MTQDGLDIATGTTKAMRIQGAAVIGLSFPDIDAAAAQMIAAKVFQAMQRVAAPQQPKIIEN